MSNTSDKLKEDMHAGAEKVKDVAHDFAAKTKDAVHGGQREGQGRCGTM